MLTKHIIHVLDIRSHPLDSDYQGSQTTPYEGWPHMCAYVYIYAHRYTFMKKLNAKFSRKICVRII